MAQEMGRPPTRAEFGSKIKGGEYKVTKAFGTFTKLLKAAGLDTYDERRGGSTTLTSKEETKLIRKYKALCSKTEKIQGFFRHTLDLDEMFARAGNPASLKMSAIFDVHAKFVDPSAWDCYLQFLKYWKPHAHLIGGDFIDCEGLSHWEPDQLEPRRIVPEMKIARQLLQNIQDAVPNLTTKIYLEGNHESWIAKAFCEMPELFEDLAELGIEINLKTMLALDKFGYDLFPLNHLVQIGKSHLTHGIYTTTNHSKKHMDVFKTNVYYGHMHDTQESNQTSVDGPMEAVCGGCLCRLDARFLKGKPNNWQHAVNNFEFFPDGSYSYYKLRIINGRMSFNGVVFDGNSKAENLAGVPGTNQKRSPRGLVEEAAKEGNA